ncbi:MAG: DUF2892 domain-containing protein [Paracoccaceae bacterium]
MNSLPNNVGGVDRLLRAVLGAVLLAVALAGVTTGALAWILGIAGAVLLATAGLSFCPLYAMIGVRTCRT